MFVWSIPSISKKIVTTCKFFNKTISNSRNLRIFAEISCQCQQRGNRSGCKPFIFSGVRILTDIVFLFRKLTLFGASMNIEETTVPIQRSACTSNADTPTYAPVLSSLLEAPNDCNESEEYLDLANEESDDNDVTWYPMYIWHSSDKKAFDIRNTLFQLGFTTYLRLEHSEVTENYELKDVYTPVFSNLIFICIKKKIIRNLKNTNKALTPLRFMIKPKRDKSEKAFVLSVPEKEMRKFMDAETRDDPFRQRVRLKYEDYLAKPGRKVRIIRGAFAGIEGEIKHIKSHRVVVVKLPSLGLANGITKVPKESLEFIE